MHVRRGSPSAVRLSQYFLAPRRPAELARGRRAGRVSRRAPQFCFQVLMETVSGNLSLLTAGVNRTYRTDVIGWNSVADLRGRDCAPKELNLYSHWFQIHGQLHRSGISGPILARCLDVAPTELTAILVRGSIKMLLLRSIAVGAKKRSSSFSRRISMFRSACTAI
jgi:hypothetical protein